MGTRNLTIVHKNGEYKVAQYGQWDGYPSGQGIGVLGFLSSGKLESLRKNAMKCSFITDEEYKDLVKDYTNADADKFFGKYPQFSRDTGSNILNLVADADDGLKLRDDYSFAADSLFCEWAYVIDLDKNIFQIYKEFNQTPLEASERFFGMVCERYANRKSSDVYHPVKLKKVFSLLDLPTIEEFLEELEPPCEGDESDE